MDKYFLNILQLNMKKMKTNKKTNKKYTKK